MKKLFTWFVLFQKRILKKPMFQITLILILLLIVMLHLFVKDKGSMIAVALYAENNDKYAVEFANGLIEKSSDLITFYICENEKDLRRDVIIGNAECGYIIPADFYSALNKYYSGKSDADSNNKGIVKVITVGETVSTRIVNEIVLGKMFSCSAYDISENFIREKQAEKIAAKGQTDRLKNFFENNRQQKLMFQFQYANGAQNKLLNQENNNYYMLPVRGMLSVLIFVCAMSGGIMLNSDDNIGTWTWIELSKRPVFNYVYILLSVFPVSLCNLIAIFCSGLAANPGWEILIMSTYALLVAGFSNILRIFVRNSYLYCSLIPVLVFLSLIVCPVFIDLGIVFEPIKYVRNILPTNYYLESVYGFSMQIKMFVAAVFVSLAGILIEKYKPNLNSR